MRTVSAVVQFIADTCVARLLNIRGVHPHWRTQYQNSFFPCCPLHLSYITGCAIRQDTACVQQSPSLPPKLLQGSISKALDFQPWQQQLRSSLHVLHAPILHAPVHVLHAPVLHARYMQMRACVRACMHASVHCYLLAVTHDSCDPRSFYFKSSSVSFQFVARLAQLLPLFVTRGHEVVQQLCEGPHAGAKPARSLFHNRRR